MRETTEPAGNRSGAELLVDALTEYGVTHVFGNPGTTELPVLRALEGGAVDYVLTLHEDIAVGMAAGYACAQRYRARRDPSVIPVGVANLHLVAGVAHGLGNLYNAAIMGLPLVVTAGNHSTTTGHEEPVLGGDLVGLTDQFTKWSAEVRHVDALPVMLRRAFRTALTTPSGPVFLSLPLDVMTAETDARPERLGTIPNAGRGDPERIEDAADLLVAAEDPVLLVGDGVARCGAVEAAVTLAEASGARVHGEILASEVSFPTDHDQWVSYLPLMDEERARASLDTDTILMVGCSTNTPFMRLGERIVAPAATCIHVTDDASRVGRRHPTDTAIVGDVGLVMSELALRLRECLSEGERAERTARAVGADRPVDRNLQTLHDGGNDSEGVSNAELVDAIRVVGGDALVVDETLTSKRVMLERWPLAPGQYVSNKGLGLGFGLPAAVGAAMAEADAPDGRPVIGFVGDGSSLYYPHTLYTASRYGVPLTVVVVNNGNYRVLEENYVEMFGDRDAPDLSHLRFEPPVEFSPMSAGYGATARTVSTPEELERVLGSSLAAPGPVVVDVAVHDEPLQADE